MGKKVRFVAFLAAAALVVFAEGLLAQSPEETMKGQIRAALDTYDRALSEGDVKAAIRVFAPKALIQAQGCGQEPRKLTRLEFRDLLAEMLPEGSVYETERSDVQIELLGGGPIGTLRDLHSEHVVAGEQEMQSRSSELFFFNKVGGSYKITSVRTAQICR